jgi:hypothetical protein
MKRSAASETQPTAAEDVNFLRTFLRTDARIALNEHQNAQALRDTHPTLARASVAHARCATVPSTRNGSALARALTTERGRRRGASTLERVGAP